MNNISCKKCSHYSSCNAPCIFIEQILQADNKIREYGNKEEIVIAPENKKVDSLSGYNQHYIDEIFNTGKETLFAEENYTAVQTLIFIDRLFNKLSFSHIQTKYGLTNSQAARDAYKQCCKRVIMACDILEKRKHVQYQAINAIENTDKFNALPKNQKAFLLFTLFGLARTEIAEILKIDVSNVKLYIRTIISQMKENKWVLNDFLDPAGLKARRIAKC